MIRIRRIVKWVWGGFTLAAIVSLIVTIQLSNYVEQLYRTTELARQASENDRYELALASNLRHSLWWLDSKIAPSIAQLSSKSEAELRAYAEFSRELNHSNAPEDSYTVLKLPILNFLTSQDKDLPPPWTAENEWRGLTTTRILSNEPLDFRLPKRQLHENDWTEIHHLLSQTSSEILSSHTQTTRELPVTSVIPTQAREEFNQRSFNNAITNGFTNASDTSNLVPVWYKGNLILGRVSNDRQIEILLIDWNSLKETLEKDVEAYLPEAQCQPIQTDDLSRDYRLASLPILLNPGTKLPPSESKLLADSTKPAIGTRLTHTAIWSSWVLTTLASGGLIAGVLHLLKRRSTFVAAMTHEIRTPLTSLRLYTDMLRDGIVTDKQMQAEYLNTLSNEVGRLEHLVENVFSFARLERTNRSIISEPHFVLETLDRIAPRLEQRCEQSHMQLVRVQDLDKDRLVVVNYYLLEQILCNLIDNACKYATHSDIKQVHLIVHRDADNQTSISVKDFGQGFSKHQKRFRPFSKSVEQAADTAPGIGLGLAICNALASEMNASLTLQNWDQGGWAKLMLKECE